MAHTKIEKALENLIDRKLEKDPDIVKRPLKRMKKYIDTRTKFDEINDEYIVHTLTTLAELETITEDEYFYICPECGRITSIPRSRFIMRSDRKISLKCCYLPTFARIIKPEED